MKRILMLFIALGTLSAMAQGDRLDKISFYGFVRNDVYVDTYKGSDAVSDLFYMLPVYAGVDAEGEDINEQLSSNMLSITSRMGFRVSGLEVFGAKLSANVETDFGGGSPDPVVIRIRKAYARLDWKKSSLLMGQDWHPFWGGDVCPSVAGLNTGCPFVAFNRSPQINYAYKAGNFKLIGAAVYQLQYTSACISSTQSSTNQAKRNGALPELVAGFDWRKDKITFGAAASYNLTKPRMTTSGVDGLVYKTDEKLASLSYIAYLRFKSEKFNIHARCMYGQNMKHFLTPSGFGVSDYDAQTGHEEYTNYNNVVGYVNAVYGKKFQVGTMIGYGKNLGTQSSLYDFGNNSVAIYGIFPKVQNFGRASFMARYNVSKLELTLEYELTTANYGIGGLNLSDGLYSQTHDVANNRLLFTTIYFF